MSDLKKGFVIEALSERSQHLGETLGVLGVACFLMTANGKRKAHVSDGGAVFHITPHSSKYDPGTGEFTGTFFVEAVPANGDGYSLVLRITPSAAGESAGLMDRGEIERLVGRLADSESDPGKWN